MHSNPVPYEMKVLETERLYLREFNNNDADFFLVLVNSPAWLQYIGDRGVKTIAEAEIFINEKYIHSYKINGFGLYVTVLKDGNIPIGICGLIKRETLEDIDIGFAFLPGYISKGYGYESASAVLKFGKDVLNIPRIVAITTKENFNSISLLKKLEMKFEKIISMPGDKEELMLFATY
jgi:RimJ/RimL family protein N-acetyltransferase